MGGILADQMVIQKNGLGSKEETFLKGCEIINSNLDVVARVEETSLVPPALRDGQVGRAALSIKWKEKVSRRKSGFC